MKQTYVYVLTMTDSNDDYNNGVFNAVFSSMEKAVKSWNEWMEEEINEEIVTRDDIEIVSVGYSRTRNGRFSWTIDEKEVM